MTVESFVASAETVLVPVEDVEPAFFAVPRTMPEARAYVDATPGVGHRLVSDLVADGRLLALDSWRTTDDVVTALYDLTLVTDQAPPAALDCAFDCTMPDGERVSCSHRVADLLWGEHAGRTVGEWLCAPGNDEVTHFDLVDELVAVLPCLLASGVRLHRPAPEPLDPDADVEGDVVGI